MKLNIYCGVRSIGWNIASNEKIVAHGVKRVNVDFDSYYAYIAGLPVTKRIDRRMKRSARRNLWRYKTRRAKLTKLLKEDERLPEGQMRMMEREKLNYLREQGCSVKLSAQEFGAVLLDIQSKRGYKSMRGVDDTGESEYLKEIAKHEEALKQHTSIGQYLNTLETNKNVIIRRERYIEEYKQICTVQGIDPARYYDAIFFQRPLKKGKIGFCKFEKNRKVTHASNPLYQYYRILRDVNNIEIFDLENNEVEISDNVKLQLVDHLWSGKDLTKAGALKIMGIKKPANYKWYSGKSITGNIWGKILGDLSSTLTQEIWQDLISAIDDEVLIPLLIRKYGFEEHQAKEIAGYDIRSLGYADVSVKAITKLNPYLQIGLPLKNAVMEVYKTVDFGTDLHLRNVVLEQVFESAKSLVNALKGKYEITEMAIEIDRLLKMGNKARKSSASALRKQDKENDEVNKKIAPYAVANDYNRKKYRLWEEMDGYSPYFPDKKIPLSELFTDKYNLDHIVPKSKLFDFSSDNLVLCPSKFNQQKDRLTGIDFASKNGNEEIYRKFVSEAKISERKRERLLMTDENIPTDFISSNSGTDYNTRCFLTLHPNSYCIPNKIVTMYQKQWKYDEYKDTDVRDALMKSFVLSEMNKDTLWYFDNLKMNEPKNVYVLTPEYSVPKVDEISVFCPKTKFFRKTKHGYTCRFSLHKESIFGQRKRIYRNAKGEMKTEIFYKIRQPIGKLSPNMVKNISDKAIQRLVAKRISEFENHADAVQSLIETPVIFNGKPVRRVSVNVNGEMLIPIHSAENGNTSKFAKHQRKVDFVYSSMNFSQAIIEGKRVTTPLIKALTALNEGKFINRGVHKGDSVLYEGKQYIISGINDAGISLRSAYTLLAEDAIKLSKPSEIGKLKKYHISQTYVTTQNS